MPQEAFKIDWTEVDSTNVHSVAYHGPSENLLVRFKNGGLYSYKGADNSHFVNMVHSQSVGKYLASVVKVLLPYTKWADEAELIEHLSSV